MIAALEKSKPFHKGKMSPKSGQVAIVLILVTAVALIFYAVTLNLGDITEVKTSTQVAATQGASLLGSQMASYGQSVFKQTLGGRRLYCKSTSLVAIIITIIITIILIIYCEAACTEVIAALWTGLALSIAAAIIQMVYVQPGITKLWNKIIAQTMSISDRFVESAIQTGLLSTVSDQKQVVDAYDLDTDRIWGFTLDGVGQIVPNDTISRFAAYYNYRIGAIKAIDLTMMNNFKNALEAFLYVQVDNAAYGIVDWGIHDMDPCNSMFTAECNRCCVPSTVVDEGVAYLIRDPTLCPLADATYLANCSATSPYGAAYPYVYDRFHGNEANNDISISLGPITSPPYHVSFLEQLGRDDENGFRMTLDENSFNVVQVPEINTAPHFNMRDAYGVVKPPAFPNPPGPEDPRRSVFPFFYKISDWGLDLTSVDRTIYADHCYWYDGAFDNILGPGICPPPVPTDWPKELRDQPLVLPEDPSTLFYDNTWWVNSTDDPLPVVGQGAIAPDAFGLPGNIIAGAAGCPQNAVTTGQGFWRRGYPRFCNSSYPYDEQCAHELGCTYTDPATGTSYPFDCGCGEAGAGPDDAYPDDLIDDLIYGLQEFVTWAQDILSQSSKNLMSDLPTWYDEFADWFEPYSPPATSDTATCGTSCCYVCTAPAPGNPSVHEGYLRIFWHQLQTINNRLTAYRNTVAFPGTSCDEVWCVPDAATGDCGAPADEAATFDANSNGVRGDLTDILACLDYNVDGPGGTGGNDVRFQSCRDNCNAASCTGLPRSMLPGFDPNVPVFVPSGNAFWDTDIQSMLNCIYDCSDPNCQAMPQYQISGSCVVYFTQNPALFDETTACYNPANQYFLTDPQTFNQSADCSGITYFSAAPSTVDFQTVGANICYNDGANYFAIDPALYDFEASGDCASWLPGNPWYDQITTILSTPGIISVADAATMNVCQISCSNANCQAMPLVPDMNETSSWYAEYSLLTLPLANAADQALITTCVNSCNNANCQVMPQFQSWGPGVPWFDNIVAALLGGTVTADDAGFLTACLTACGDITCQAMPQYENYWKPGNSWYDEMQTALLVASPGDLPALNLCNTECSAQNVGAIDPACQAMPQIDVGTCGAQYFATNPAITFNAAVDCTTPPPPGLPRPNNTNNWYNDIVAALNIANPSGFCDLSDADGNPTTIADNGWLLNIEISTREARNQTAKFRQRRNFLASRASELDNLISIFDTADTQFDNFLTGPVNDFIRARIDNAQNSEFPSGLPYQAIYAWQNPPSKNRPAPNENEGYYSIVKVEARSPNRCNNACGVGGGPDPAWPKTRTYTKNWGLKRCYELINTEGIVKFRVTRYDENRDTNVLRFPNGRKIWDFRYFHPSYSGPAVSAANLIPPPSSFGGGPPAGSCPALVLADPPGAAGTDAYGGAIIMNNLINDPTDPNYNESCWSLIAGPNGILKAGVMTEVCAQYYYHEGSQTSGFSHEFIDCNSVGW